MLWVIIACVIFALMAISKIIVDKSWVKQKHFYTFSEDVPNLKQKKGENANVRFNCSIVDYRFSNDVSRLGETNW